MFGAKQETGTPKNAKYKKKQREVRASKYRGWVIQGTRVINRIRRKGKAVIKAAKKLTHTKGYYLAGRSN